MKDSHKADILPSATQFIPPYSLFWVDMVHDYWMMRDDPEFVKGFLPGIEDVIIWYTHRIDPETGLLGKVPYWNFVDWAREWPWIDREPDWRRPQPEDRKEIPRYLPCSWPMLLNGQENLFQYFGHSAKAESSSNGTATHTSGVF